MEKKNKLSDYVDTLWMAVGEAVVALLVLIGFLIAGALGIEITVYKVITGALLGGLVTVGNFLILSIGVNRAVKGYIEGRGDKEMTEEEADEYAKKNAMNVQLAMTKSYLLRMLLMVGALALAGITKQFNVLATAIPLLMYRPILYVTEFIKVKVKAKRGD